MIFGVFIPQGWKMELASIPDPRDKWAKAVEVAELAERLGYDSLWVYDHVHNVPVPAHEAVFEAWATVAAISQRTSTIRLGQMVGCAGYRNPALLAKMTSSIDVMSGGGSIGASERGGTNRSTRPTGTTIRRTPIASGC